MSVVKQNAYALAGVDVDIEAEASRVMYEASKATHKNRAGKFGEITTPFDDFAGLRMVAAEGLPEGSFFSMGFDTVGTKVTLAERTGIHDTIAYDLFAMVCDDAVLRGGEPVLIGSTLDIRSLGSDDRFLPVLRDLARGYVAAAEDAGVAVINGEIAQMGSLISGYGDFPYHWGAACVWFARKEKLFTGREIQVGDSVVMLREHGFRANGWSLIRKVFREAHGDEWHEAPFEESKIGVEALKPSIIYSKCVVALHGGFQTEGTTTIHGVAHITGGGIPEKMNRVLRPSGLGAELTDLFAPPPIMAYCQKLGGISDRDAYGTWNMGQGMALITPAPEKAVEEAKKFGIEAKIAGKIVKTPGVRLVSAGIEASGELLSFEDR